MEHTDSALLFLNALLRAAVESPDSISYKQECRKLRSGKEESLEATRKAVLIIS